MRRTRTAVGVVAAGTALSLAAAGLASADDVFIGGQASGNAAATFGPAGGFASARVQLLVDNGGNDVDPVPGCNATPAAPVTITFSSDQSWATAPQPLTFTSCGVAQDVQIALAAGTPAGAMAKVSGAATGGRQDVEVEDGHGKSVVIKEVDSAYRDDFITVHVGQPTCPTSADLRPAVPASSVSADSTSGWYDLATGAPALSLPSGSQYSWDAGSWSDYATPVTAAEGVHVLHSRAHLAAAAPCGEVFGATTDTTYSVDLTRPSLVDSGWTTQPDGLGSWYVSRPTNRFTASDSGSGLVGTSSIDVQTTSAQKGTGVTVSSGPVSDVAGNTTPAVTSTAVSVDLDDPAPVFTPKTVYTLGEVAPTCSGTDPVPGSGFADCSVGGFSSSTFTTTGSMWATALDNAGRTGSSTPVTYSVRGYAGVGDGGCPGGIRQPIACDNLSTFSRGKGVPVKFGLRNDGPDGTKAFPNGFPTGGWEVVAQPMSCPAKNGTGATANGTAVKVANLQGGTVFRYDVAGDQYVYNADLRGLPTGSCWRFQVALDGGAGQTLTSATFKLTN